MVKGILNSENNLNPLVEIVTGANLVPELDTVYCPLTLNLPPTFQFWGRSIAQICLHIDALRHLAATSAGVKVGEGGNMWLPVVWTARGPIYAEVIGTIATDSYQQPIHLDDRDRQPLYQFAYQLLSTIAAPPATYLIQFCHQQREVVFDRLLPFPALPALASVGIQQPDLFTCHWRCITQQPILDLLVSFNPANNLNATNKSSAVKNP